MSISSSLFLPLCVFLVQKAIEEEMDMGVIMHKSATFSRQCVEAGNCD